LPIDAQLVHAGEALLTDVRKLVLQAGQAREHARHAQ
jgi:hypothetical protein